MIIFKKVYIIRLIQKEEVCINMCGLLNRDSFVSERKVITSRRDKKNSNQRTKIAIAIFIVVIIGISTLAVTLTHKNSSVNTTRATANHIVINEVYYDAPTGYSEPQNEWIELYNPTSSDVDISGWNITDYEGNWSFPSGTSIPAGGFLLVVNDATYMGEFNSLFPGVTPNFDTNTSNNIPDVSVSGSVSLANTGDDVHLIDSSGNVVDVVWYGSGGDMGSTNAAKDVSAGHSIARYYNAQDTGNPSVDFYDESNPTPAAQNSQAVPELNTFALMIIIFIAMVCYRKNKNNHI